MISGIFKNNPWTMQPQSALRRGIKCASGAFAVEFALITPILLMLLLAGFDVSLAVFRKMELEGAAKIATQYGMLRKPVQGDLTAIQESAKNVLPAAWFAPEATDPATVTANLSCLCPSSGAIACTLTCPPGELRETYLNVQITKVHNTLFDYPWMSSNFSLQSNASVRLQ